jgi:hypothetical protein
MSILGSLILGDPSSDGERLVDRYFALSALEHGGESLTSRLFPSHNADLERQDKALSIQLKRKALGLPIDESIMDEDIDDGEDNGLENGARAALMKDLRRSLPLPVRGSPLGSQTFASEFSGVKSGLIPHLKTGQTDGLARSIGGIFRRR